MNCSKCSKEVMPDRSFCIWCGALLQKPAAGVKAPLWRRLAATVVEPLIISVLALIVFEVADAMSGVLGFVFALIGVGFYIKWALVLLAKGQTPGKWVMDVYVVDKNTGDYPGFWRMMGRETIGRMISSAVMMLGYAWALWDKNNQAWHDKIFDTLVVYVDKNEAAA